MNRLFAIALLILAITLVAVSVSFAASTVKSFALDLQGIETHSSSTIWSSVFDTFSYEQFSVDCIIGTTPMTDLAALDKHFLKYEPAFEYIDSFGNWDFITTSILSSSKAIISASDEIIESPTTFSSKYYRQEYTTVSGSTDTTRSKNCNPVTVVSPGPSSMIALATGAVGVLGLIKKRRA